jgi:hypothetical protein
MPAAGFQVGVFGIGHQLGHLRSGPVELSNQFVGYPCHPLTVITRAEVEVRGVVVAIWFGVTGECGVSDVGPEPAQLGQDRVLGEEPGIRHELVTDIEHPDGEDLRRDVGPVQVRDITAVVDIDPPWTRSARTRNTASCSLRSSSRPFSRSAAARESASHPARRNPWSLHR